MPQQLPQDGLPLLGLAGGEQLQPVAQLRRPAAHGLELGDLGVVELAGDHQIKFCHAERLLSPGGHFQVLIVFYGKMR